ncbi:MAG: PEP/pyruvate-binding domain-containing protein [Planctomycetota bacterium]
METPPASEEVGGKAAGLFRLAAAGLPIPKTLVDPPDLARALEELGGVVAVRSSASVEDGHAHSFAGQFESVLDLREPAAVEAAVARCRAALDAPALRDYCRRAGIDPAQVRMHVIVQEMIQPELAGVAFGVNPVSGAEEVVIEAVAGVADQLLQGHVPPLPAEDPRVQRHAPAVQAAVRAAQRAFGEPLDVEFACRETGEVVLLQARPITRIGFAPELGEWTTADMRDGGVSSEACTPLMESLYDLVFQAALPGFLREIKLLDGDFDAMRHFYGRPYWNLGAVKACMAKLPGFVEREFDLDLNVEPLYEGQGRTTPLTLRTLLGALPTAFAVPRAWKRQARVAHGFLEGGWAAREARWDALELGALDDAALAQALRELIEGDYFETELAYFRTIFCASTAKQDLLEAFPDANYVALVGGLPPISHLEPTRELRAMAARGETDVTPLLSRFRHHSRRELDLRVPRWDEDRAFVEALLESYRQSPGVVDEARPRRAFEEARAQALAALPWYRRRAFLRKLERTRHFVWLREQMRDLSCRAYYQVRRLVLELARRRGLGDDAFFMSWEQLVADERGGIAAARADYESYRHFQAPHELGARFRVSFERAQGALTGIGASQGQAEGPARVARTAHEALAVEPGAILVCPFTDPGWTPALEKVAAVVTETGGLLSHAAVICREYGKPAVLGVEDATHRIKDGERLRVDGGAGVIERAG